mgnify:CR=1 FL=1
MDILIADDSALIRDRVKDALYQVSETDRIHEASTIEDTMNRIEAYTPGVIILDLRMPDGSGTDVLKTVKAYPEPPIVIVFTNYPYPQYRRKCMEWGADYFFDKSADLEKLAEIVTRIRQGTIGTPEII